MIISALFSHSNKCDCVERFFEPISGAASCDRCFYTCLTCSGYASSDC